MADKKETVAFVSILASAGLAIAKLIAAFVSGSLALLSDALHSVLDVGATILTYFAVRISAKPADARHPYGHGKVEAVAALIETGLLFVIAVLVAFEAISRLWRGEVHELPTSYLAYGVLLGSIVVDIWRSRALMKVAEETGSEALEADALHFTSDLVSSVLVLAGLLAANLGFPQGDSLAAIGVAGFIAVAGYRLGKRTVDTLMDAVPAGLSDKIRAIAGDVPGVAGIESVRVRSVGTTTFAELSVKVSRTLPLDRLTVVKSDITAAIQSEYPGASVIVAAVPVALDEETILERILHVAAVMRRPVHHVTIQRLPSGLSVSLDLEVDGRLSVREGHAITTELEAAIERELGPGVEVETHLEPLEIHTMDGTETNGTDAARVAAALERCARQTGKIDDVHDVRVRRTTAGLVVNYHCNVSPTQSIAEMHNHVDALERAVRQEIPEIIRVVGHAEPRPG
jgi:cation diffusion facilitator family transporter